MFIVKIQILNTFYIFIYRFQLATHKCPWIKCLQLTTNLYTTTTFQTLNKQTKLYNLKLNPPTWLPMVSTKFLLLG